MSGYGVYTWSKEEKFYEGTFLMDKKHGWGKMTLCDGSYYEGEWKENLKDGIGSKMNAKGEVTYGRWKSGQMTEEVGETKFKDAKRVLQEELEQETEE